MSILKGGRKSLRNAVGLELEVEFAALYENQPLFNEIDSFVRNEGFELIDLRRYFWKRDDVQLLWRQKGTVGFW